MQHLHRDAPLVLPPTMLARQFVDAPLKGFSHAKIISAERQHRLAQSRTIEPIRERHGNRDHAPFAGAAHNRPRLDQAKALRDLDPTGGDVGGDARAREPLERIAQTLIAIAAGVPTGGGQKIMGGELQRPADGAARVDGGHQLAQTEDQDVLVVDRGPPLHRRDHGHFGAVMGVVQHTPVRARGQ